MILNINQLRAFHTAAKLRSVTLAAKELMVTPPAISMLVKQFEESFDVKLMYRDGNSIQLTDLGKSLFKKCNRIFKQIKDMEDFLGDITTTKLGVLRIGCPQTHAKYLMPPLIAEFKKSYPGIKIVLDQGNSSEMRKSILDHKNELAVVRYRSKEKRLKVKIIGREELILIAAPESKYAPRDEISVTQLSTIPLILPREGSATREVILEYFKKFKVTPLIAMESENIDLIKELVSQDDGVSLLVRVGVKDDLKNKRLRAIRILAGSPTLEYGIGYQKRPSLSPGAWAFLRLLDRMDGKLLPAR